jgi:hypothetical protein
MLHIKSGSRMFIPDSIFLPKEITFHIDRTVECHGAIQDVYRILKALVKSFQTDINVHSRKPLVICAETCVGLFLILKARLRGQAINLTSPYTRVYSV